MNFRKNNKKLIIVLGASALALGTVGFASWVITEQVSIAKQDVNVTFGEVENSSVVATLDSGKSDFKLAFDALQDSTGKITAVENKEDLSFHFNFSIKVGQNVKLSGVKFDVNPDPFTNLVTQKYITAAYAATQTVNLIGVGSAAAGTYVTSDFTSYTKGEATGKPQSHVVTFDDATNTYTFISTFTFKRGEKFNGKNPSVADNENSGSLTADQIVTNLNEFKKAYGATTGQKVGVTIIPLTSKQ